MPPSHPEIIEDPYEFQRLLGFSFVDWTAEHALIEVPLRAALTNRYGIPHGGVYAALLDTVMGYAGCFTGDPKHPQLAMTLTLNVSFLAQPEGQTLFAEGRKTGGGRRTFFAEGTVTDDTGRVIARASGAFRYRGSNPTSGTAPQ